MRGGGVCRTLLVLLFLATPAFAQDSPPASIGDLPAAVQGTFAAGTCAAPERLLHITARSIVFLAPGADEHLMRLRRVQSLGEWSLAVGSGEDQPRVLLRPAAAAPGLDFGVPSVKLLDSQLPGDTPVTHLIPCTEIPPELALLHGEGIAFLHALEAMEAACGGDNPKPCLDAFMAYADVNRDGRLSAAEITRVIRGASWAVQMAAGTSDGTLAAGLLGSALIGLGAAEIIVRSFDYDGKGTITPEALLLDRLPFPAMPQARSTGAAPLPLEALGSQVGSLKELFSRLPALPTK
ncbi:MAG: hypothetical protein JO264_05250 [Acidisphaera sp.]|nr:hypothetical protein [Acidisphaera sp.]